MTQSSVTQVARGPRRRRVVAILVAAALVMVLVAWLAGRPQGRDASPPSPVAATSTAQPSASEPVAAESGPETSVATPAAYAGCDPLDAAGFVPAGFEMDNPQADEPVLSLGLDAEGNIAAPPPDQPRTASWWNQGPRPGSAAGKVVLSIHTYRDGGALGNEMYTDAGPTLLPGDLIRLVGEDGRTACYEFVEASKVWVEDYDPDSDVMVDYDGDPMLAIVICWDLDRATEVWESRIFFYAVPVTA